MKKLQVVKDDALRPYTSWAQVKEGRVIVLTGHLIINLPAEEVFGQKVEGHWYIDRKMWGLLKFPSAKAITVEDGKVKNITAGTEMQMLTPSEWSDKFGNYPDWKVVTPDRFKPLAAVERIGFNADLYKQIVDCWGIKPERVRINFYGPDRAMTLDSYEEKGWALLMPIFIKNDDFKSAFYNPKTDENDESFM